MTLDPTRQRDQPALTTSSGLIWLVMGGLLGVIAVGTLLALNVFWPVVVITLIYAGMLIVRGAVRPGRLRLGLLAAGMIGIAAVGLGAVLVIAGTS